MCNYYAAQSKVFSCPVTQYKTDPLANLNWSLYLLKIRSRSRSWPGMSTNSKLPDWSHNNYTYHHWYTQYLLCLIGKLTCSQSYWCRFSQTFRSLSKFYFLNDTTMKFYWRLTLDNNKVFPASQSPIKVTNLPRFLCLLNRIIIVVSTSVIIAKIIESSSMLNFLAKMSILAIPKHMQYSN